MLADWLMTHFFLHCYRRRSGKGLIMRIEDLSSSWSWSGESGGGSEEPSCRGSRSSSQSSSRSQRSCHWSCQKDQRHRSHWSLKQMMQRAVEILMMTLLLVFTSAKTALWTNREDRIFSKIMIYQKLNE